MALLLGWGIFFVRNFQTYREYAGLKTEAEESLAEGLYEQAIELYKNTLEYKNSVQTYLTIEDIYEQYYAEEHTAFVRECYIADMAQAAAEYPEREEFWLAQIELHQEAENDSKAYDVAKKAKNSGVDGEKLDTLYQQLLYEVELDYKLYTEMKTCLNGYITVNDGNQWTVLDESGEACSSKYQFIGLINDDGMGIYTNDIDTRLLDDHEVTRARLGMGIEDAGYYTESSGYVPVKIEGKWKYMNTSGEFLPGEFEEAGCFYNNKAAVKQEDGWYLIDHEGNAVSEKYTDIKLDLQGNYVQGEVILAKEKDKYHIYDAEFQQIGDFACDDMDICLDNGLIAFKQGEKWGYVDTEGNIVVEPQYEEAKSFSNHMAAVRDENGLWGFINRNYDLVIACEYEDVSYFNQSESCMVSVTDGVWQLMSFRFE